MVTKLALHIQLVPLHHEHQKQHWRSHKAVCGAKAAAASSPTVTDAGAGGSVGGADAAAGWAALGYGAGAGAGGNATPAAAAGAGANNDDATTTTRKCTRCLQPCDAPAAPGIPHCRVPHPVHLRQDLGTVFSGGQRKQHFGCGACGGQYTVTADFGDADGVNSRITAGPKFCFDGAHTAAPLAADDERRVVPNTVNLTAGPNLQRDIDALPADVVMLIINAGAVGYDESRETRLC